MRDARLRQLKPLELKSRSLGCLDNKALNRSVLRRQGWLVVGWSWPPIVSDSIFTNLHNLSARLTRALSNSTFPSQLRFVQMKFSILSVILLTTICVMGIKIYQDRSKIEGLQRLAAENEQSGGTFHIENLSQFHIRRLHSACLLYTSPSPRD